MKRRYISFLEDFLFILLQSFKSFLKNRDFNIAASLTYYSLFALIPLLLLMVYVSSYFISSSEVIMGRMRVFLNQFVPNLSDMFLKEIQTLANQKGLFGIFNLALFVWLVMPVVDSLRVAFNTIFRLEEHHSFIKAKSISVGVIVINMAVWTILIVVSITLERFFKGKLPSFGLAFIPFFMVFLTISILYATFLPSKVEKSYLFLGSFVTASLWEVMRRIFTAFMTYNPKFGFIFGSLKTIFVGMLWIYYSCCVVLFGAEFVSNLRRRDVLLLRSLFGNGYRVSPKVVRKFGRRYKKGEIIVKEGTSGKEMFFIISGSVTVEREGVKLAKLCAGDYFGEMSLLLGDSRSATVLANEETEVIAIDPESFETLLREEPKVAIKLLKEFARRLKALNEKVEDLAKDMDSPQTL